MMKVKHIAVVTLILCSLPLGACSRSKGAGEGSTPGDLTPQSGGAVEPFGPGATGRNLGDEAGRLTGPGVSADQVLQKVYFDYDKADIRPDQRAVLDKDYEYLKANPNQRIIVEGHCDERGTVEYNFALGERRATQVKAYLVNRGIDKDRIKYISMGKEAPAVPGHNEAAWSKNRRAEFKFEE
ncbi:MAG: peptidoglycan-associated lipoprotein Pal [Candidatus Sumerlaeota bacterium]|nr:peptidoglycan-associated lipoprotein Pal [Candidatus Sumerlaeota bacterium]